MSTYIYRGLALFPQFPSGWGPALTAPARPGLGHTTLISLCTVCGVGQLCLWGRPLYTALSPLHTRRHTRLTTH